MTDQSRPSSYWYDARILAMESREDKNNKPYIVAIMAMSTKNRESGQSTQKPTRAVSFFDYAGDGKQSPYSKYVEGGFTVGSSARVAVVFSGKFTFHTAEYGPISTDACKASHIMPIFEEKSPSVVTGDAREAAALLNSSGFDAAEPEDEIPF